MQSSFTNDIATETKVEVVTDGLNAEVPFADFSCDIKSFKPVLNRDADTFTITLKGNETTERCGQKFSAQITGVVPGTYWLKVIYQKAGSSQQVLYQQFTIAK